MGIGRFNDFDKVDEKMSPEGQEYVSNKIGKLRGEGKGAKQAAAIAYSYAKRKGFKVSPKKNESLQEEANNHVEAFKETVTKVFMEYDKSKFTQAERDEILDWLGDKSTVSFFAGLLKESDNPLNDEANPTIEVSKMTSLQFYKLIDLLEADILAYDVDDLEYYTEMIGIDVPVLMDLYAAYGYNLHKYAETDKLKAAYIKETGKTWETIRKEAEAAE